VAEALLSHKAPEVEGSAEIEQTLRLAQIRQPNTGTIPLNQTLFSILAGTSALGAGQVHHFSFEIRIVF